MSDSNKQSMQTKMQRTSTHLKTIQGHVSSLSARANIEEEDLNQLLGKLQYHIAEVEQGIHKQSTTNLRKPVVRRLTDETPLNHRNIQSFSQSTSAHQTSTNGFSRTQFPSSLNSMTSLSSTRYANQTMRDLMAASKGFLNDPRSTKTQHHNNNINKATDGFDIKHLNKQSNDSQVPSQQLQDPQQRRTMYFQKNIIANPGKISNSQILPKHIRRNPFFDLPPLSESDLNKGIFNLVNIGLIPKDLDVLPAFNQGSKLLQTSKKKKCDPSLKHIRLANPSSTNGDFEGKFALDLQTSLHQTTLIPLNQSSTFIQQNSSLIADKYSLETGSGASMLLQDSILMNKNQRNDNTTIQNTSNNNNNFFLTNAENSFASYPKAKSSQLIPTINNNNKSSNSRNQQQIAKKSQAINTSLVSDGKKRVQVIDELQLQQQKQQQLTQQNRSGRTKDYTFTILNGFVQTDSQDYIDFRNQYYDIWGSIQGLLKNLTKLVIESKIKLVRVDANKLVELVSDLHHCSVEQLIKCVQDEGIMLRQALLGKGSVDSAAVDAKSIKNSSKFSAALKIMSWFKSCLAKRVLQKKRQLMQDNLAKREKISNWIRHQITKMRLRRILAAKWQKSTEISTIFAQDFQRITSNSSMRVEIHFNSTPVHEFQRMTIDHFSQRELLQIPRIFAIKDPKVSVIFVTQRELPAEVISYYYKICELGELHDYKERLHFISIGTKVAKQFPLNFSAAKLLYYSPKIYKKITKIIDNRPAYIVPGQISNEDVLLSVAMNIPIFGSTNIANVQQLQRNSTSSIFFDTCQLPSAPSSRDIFTEEDLFNKLTILIARFPAVQMWLFKVDGEFRGRGIASISLEAIRVINEFRAKQTKKDKGVLDESTIAKIREVVVSLLPLKLSIATPNLFANYNEFLAYFLEHSGIIEAAAVTSTPTNTSINSTGISTQISNSPSIFFRIDPDGSSTVLAAYDRVSTNVEFVNFACSFPQQSLPQLNMKAITSVLAENLFNHGIIGYITVDMVAFPDVAGGKSSHPLFWMIGIDCAINDYSASYFLFDFLAKGRLDRASGKYHMGQLPDKILPEIDELEISNSDISQEPEDISERAFLYIPFIYHKQLKSQTFRDFFFLCRKHEISFDIERRIGSIFLLLDLIDKGTLSIISISESPKRTLKLMTEALNFLLQITEGTAIKKHKKPEFHRSDRLEFMDIVSRIRSLNKNVEAIAQAQQVLNPNEVSF